jgi:hypothetical protein
MYSVPCGTAHSDIHVHGLLISLLLITLTRLLRPVSFSCFTLHYHILHTYMWLGALYSPRRINASNWPPSVRPPRLARLDSELPVTV